MKRFLVLSFMVLLHGAFAPAYGQTSTPVAGKDYIEIPDGKPLKPIAGKVVVEEFFNYICPACFKFESEFSAWTKKVPAYVEVVHIPAAFRQDFENYAKVFYAAQILGVEEKSHQAVYNAVHVTSKLPGEGQTFDDDKIATFYTQYGVDPKQFLSTMKSFGVSTKVRIATEHLKSCKISSTPSLVINGRYLVTGKSFSDNLRIASYLIEKAHAERPAYPQ